MSTKTLVFDMLIEPSSLTPATGIDLLHHLWEHGFQFAQTYQLDYTEQATWESQQNIIPWAMSHGTEGLLETPLIAAMTHIIEGGRGRLRMFDGYHEFHLEVRTPLRSGEHVSAFTHIMLELDNAYRPIHSFEEMPERSYLAPNQQAFVAFVHWAGIISEIVAPTFGYGYDPDVDDATAHSHSQEIERDLMQKHVPDARYLTWLTYISSQLLNSTVLQKLWDVPHQRLQRLANMGVLVYTPPEDYRYEARAGYIALQQAQRKGDAFLRQPQQGSTQGQVVLDILADYERALTLFKACDHQLGETMVRGNLTGVAEARASAQQNLSQSDSAQELRKKLQERQNHRQNSEQNH